MDSQKLNMKTTPQRNKTPSPIKVKDYFTNPLHKIRQPSFTEIEFSTNALNTFVKNFTNRHNNKYISLNLIKGYIKSFTNNNPKIMMMYEEFFIKNFKQKEPGMIETSQFMDFFVKQGEGDKISLNNINNFYESVGEFTSENLLQKAKSLQISLTEAEAHKIIRMINYQCGETGANKLSLSTFQQVLQSKKYQQS